MLSAFHATIIPSEPDSPASLVPTIEASDSVSASGLSSLDSPLSTLPSLPGLELVDPNTNVEGQIIFLDFDGAVAVIYNGPVTVGPFDVPAFEAPGKLAGQEDAIIVSVVEQLEQTFAGSGVIFTTDDPAEGLQYSTVYIGGDDSAFRAYGSFDGLAEAVDIGNSNSDDNALIFATASIATATFETVVEQISGTASHEVGHIVGYSHTTDTLATAEMTPLLDVAHLQQVHVYLAEESYDFYVSQFGTPDLSKNSFSQGAFDEDEHYLNPWDEYAPYTRHFWDHYGDYSRRFDDGLLGYDSAPNRAYKYFTGGYGLDGEYDSDWGKNAMLGRGIQWMYSNGYATQAFIWLGHVVHLLEDIAEPAHAHGDQHAVGDDQYEKHIGSSSSVYMQWGYPSGSRGRPNGDILLPQDEWSGGYRYDPLYELFSKVAGRAGV
ncbi:MAG: hypothetical protein O3C40_19145 [Planctomycetota bacterium]|nr:hypothetical protein [Planctomycetota bacterium]